MVALVGSSISDGCYITNLFPSLASWVLKSGFWSSACRAKVELAITLGIRWQTCYHTRTHKFSLSLTLGLACTITCPLFHIHSHPIALIGSLRWSLLERLMWENIRLAFYWAPTGPTMHFTASVPCLAIRDPLQFISCNFNLGTQH